MAWKILSKRGVACMLSPTLPKKFKRNVLPKMKTDLILSLLRYQYFKPLTQLPFFEKLADVPNVDKISFFLKELISIFFSSI